MQYQVIAKRSSNDKNSIDNKRYKALLAAVQVCKKCLQKEADKQRKKVKKPSRPDITLPQVAYIKQTKHLKQYNQAAIQAAKLALITAAFERKKRNREKVKKNQQLCILVNSFKRKLRQYAKKINRMPLQSLKQLASIDPTKLIDNLFQIKDKDKT